MTTPPNLADDYTLTGSSVSCIDLGTSSIPEYADLQFDSDLYYFSIDNSMFNGDAPDIGVYESDFEISSCGSGDINDDGSPNILDVVALVNLILSGGTVDTDGCIGDMNSDGSLNVLDIVALVDMILNPALSRGESASAAVVSYGNGHVGFESDGIIAGLQFAVNGIFDITENYLPAGWEIDYNETIILLYSLDGSALENKLLFEYEGDLVIEESIIGDWYGSDISVQTVTLLKEFSLERAYPNPFNPVTTIQYGLPIDATVNIIIYDLQGRIAAELVSGMKPAGHYSLKWDASDQASGIYFVKMLTPEFTKTQELMLVK